MKKLCLLSALMILVINAFAQDNAADTLRKDALNVYMTASDYVRKEIPYVNYVRDIKDADVYIISTSQPVGSGGTEFSYFLVGQRGNAGMADTISFVTTPGETQDEIRTRQVRTLKMGLMRYVARTPLAQYMNITFTKPLSETVASDKWNSWVFRTSLSGFLQGEQTYKSTYLSSDLSATRVTHDWKINIRGRYNYSRDVFEIDNEKISSKNNSRYISSLVVRSITDHWSYGGSAYAGSSSYSNENLNLRIMPGIEYDLFPYSESTRRQLRLLYSIGYNYVNYNDSTIYNKLKEGHLQHSFNASYEVVQKWGSIDISCEYSNYMHNWSRNNLSMNGFINLRIYKGLNVNFGGGASLVHDQLGLVKGGATKEEILLRRKEIATQFNYFTSFGLSWTFGSIYNNVVNPRFGSIGGGGMTIMMN